MAPKKKHRPSWMYEGQADSAPPEDTLATSPVELTYPSEMPMRWGYIPTTSNFEEPAIEAPNDSPRAEEAAEEAPPDDLAIEIARSDDEFAAEAAANDAPAEDYVVEAALAEEYPVDKDVSDEEASPVVEEPEATTELPESLEELVTSADNKSDDALEDVPKDKAKLEDQPGEIVSICTSCTTMLFTSYEGPSPYSFTYLMGPDHESHSWLLHTTCFSCVNRYKRKAVSRTKFGNDCTTAFATAMLSEEFIKKTGWFDLAARACQKPMRILMDAEGRSVAYAKIDTLREETTNKCRMRGFRKEMDGRAEILESFVPGGFL